MERELDNMPSERSTSSDSSALGCAEYDDARQKLNRTQRFLRTLKNLPIKVVNFFGIYLLIVFAYLSFVALMASWIYYVAEPPGYLDSLFTVVSAITCTGLITFDTSQVPFGGQFIIWLLILTGSSVFNTVFPLFLRLYRFQRLLWSSTKTCDTRWVVVQRNAILVLLASAIGYWFFVQLGTAIFLVIYSRADRDILDIYDGQGVNYVWGSFFFAVSAFNNAGFSVFATNTIPFASEWVMLTTLAWLILAGNTCYPIFLRLWFLILRIVTFGKSPVINLLHRKPRAYYTHLFSFQQTMVITTFVVTSLALQFTVNTALDFNYANGELTGLSAFYKIWNVGFQSISTRNAGFNSVNIALSSSAVLWLYVVLMFVGVFPVAASIRSTRRSARVSGREALMTLVLRDLIFCVVCLLLLLLVQYENMRTDPNFTIFSLLFEVISAFGNVGLSLGYGSDVTSLSGRFNTLGKLIIIAVMMAGKHRALATSGDIALAGDREYLDRNKGLMEDPTKAADVSQSEP